jgi:hypothetical protein
VNTTNAQAGTGLEDRTARGTWDGEPLVTYTRRLDALAGQLPRVERRPFGLGPPSLPAPSTLRLPGLPPPAENPYYDLIVRLPDQHFAAEVPVGIVSKRYRLVQHRDLVDGVVEGLKVAQVPWQSLQTDVRITQFGSRLHFSVHLPERFRALIDHDGLDLTIECFNSVDRSWAFRVGMGWIRLACGNGLFVGRVTATMRHPHVETLRVEHVPGLVVRGFAAAEADASRWRARAETTVSSAALESWADAVVTKKWGVLAAARTLHIWRTGHDGRFQAPTEKAPASRRAMVLTDPVPGCAPPNGNVFRVGQILAWLANSLGEWSGSLERRRQVPELLAPLVRAAGHPHAQITHGLRGHGLPASAGLSRAAATR